MEAYQERDCFGKWENSPRGHYHPAEAGIARLACWLTHEGYHGSAVGRICEYTRREETPTGAPDLDPRDEEHAEHAYVEGCEPVSRTDAAWDEFGTDPGRGPVYQSVGADYTLDRLDHAMASPGRMLVSPVIDAPPDEWPTEEEKAEFHAQEKDHYPISGGAPSAEEVVETVRRWYRTSASFSEWLDSNGGIAWEEGRDEGAK